ncbi:AIPR family protein [Desulforamulus aquiferis]|uniref:AIPR family protein n=1 Tax=Desulforamulus aquiferis TaxID=1397668 RepID=A0AAW7ZIK2_9FIRM|nr:AIPR family protein [Desulforamulus aquiferis]MDO7789121.1 AIPR family protein [Desulforamulus aquiferis]
MQFIEKFKESTSLIEKFKEDGAYLCWVMALYLERNDIIELATDGLTDGSNDKKIDFIDLDISNGKIILAQGYYSQSNNKDEAPANKASDLNTAAAWLISGNLADIPNNLRDIIKTCREAIDNDDIDSIEILYVHNLPESDNCKKELLTVAAHLSALFENKGIDIIGKELGISSIEALYRSKKSQIVIKDKIEFDSKPVFRETSDGWNAYLFSVSGDWLYNLYKRYGEDLFSANYRGFLGSGKRKKINNEIRQSAEAEPNNFWAYNNGITILTLDIDNQNEEKTTIIGASIINGAQTTGSIGSVDDNKLDNLKKIKILCRVIKCSDVGLIPKIIKTNNTQNAITSWDVYSNDTIQVSLKKKFDFYCKPYSLKRGFDDDYKSGLGIVTVAQPTLAFEGNYAEANRGKNNIFINKYLYKAVFENKKARHLLLTYTLSKAVDEIKYNVKQTPIIKQNPTENDKKKLELFRNLKFKMFFISIIADCLESIIDSSVDKNHVAISKDYAVKPIEEIINNWIAPANSVLTALVGKIKDTDINDYINNKYKYYDLCKDVSSLISMLKDTSGSKTFASVKLMIRNG